ncbi:MAG: tripartite tricarboxylate transporter substrate-binding protein [Pseudomonadota bacterium]
MKKLIAALTLTAIAAAAQAQLNPDRPIKIIVPQPPGGGADLILRAMAPEVQKILKISVVVENRPGGNEVIAADAVAKAPADGHTLGLISSTFNINQLGLGAKIPYDSQKDFTPVAYLARVPMALFVPNDLGPKDLKSFVALSKAKPGQLNYVSLGPTTFQGIAADYLRHISGADLVPIPYSGRGTTQALLGGEVQMAMIGFGAAGPLMQSGKVTPIAITSKTRMKVQPNVPTVAETYPGYDVTPWYGLVAPAGTPPAVIKRLHEAFSEVVGNPAMAEKFFQLGSEPTKMTLEAYQAHLAQDLVGWRNIVSQIPKPAAK